MSDYVSDVLEQVKEKNQAQPKFIQTVEKVFESLKPVFEKHPENGANIAGFRKVADAMLDLGLVA